jgi:hypothetical protein
MTPVAMSNERSSHGFLNPMSPIKAPFSFSLLTRLRKMACGVTFPTANDTAVWSRASEFAVFVHADINNSLVLAKGTFFKILNASVSDVGRLLDTCKASQQLLIGKQVDLRGGKSCTTSSST